MGLSDELSIILTGHGYRGKVYSTYCILYVIIYVIMHTYSYSLSTNVYSLPTLAYLYHI